MSLQTTVSVDAFCQACSELWTSWRTGASPAVKAHNRQTKMRRAIIEVTGFMAPLDIRFSDLGGDCGQFSWSDWQLTIDNNYTGDDAITYAEFVELCGSAYHEARHAEQFHRIAQGLALGRLHFPDKSGAQIIQDLRQTGSKGGVKAKVALFESKGIQQASVASRRQLIARWLNIPLNVAGTAETARSGFDGFLGLPRPQWFKRHTNLLEVEEWMRSTYKRTLGGMNRWAQSDHGPYKIYRDLPEEHDAHEIEKLIKRGVKQRIAHNYDANKDQPRSNTALFGA